MSASVLVVYATRYGSTQAVAEAIAAALRERGLAVDLHPARNVRSVEGYGAVVVGAPLYIGRWHKDASRFLRQHQAALAARPVAVFALGPLHDSTDQQEWQSARAQLDGELAAFPWLTPVALELFGGAFDPAKLGFADRLLASLPASPLHRRPPSDARDWAAISRWAGSLAATLQPAAPAQGG